MEHNKRTPLPFQSQAALDAWAQRISVSRRIRRWTVRDLAAKAAVSPSTVIAAEKGDAGVRLENWLRILWALDLVASLQDAALAGTQSPEFRMMSERLPLRVRR